MLEVPTDSPFLGIMMLRGTLRCSTACGLVLPHGPGSVGSWPVANSRLAFPWWMYFRPYMAGPWLPWSCTHRRSQQRLFHRCGCQDVPCSFPGSSSNAYPPQEGLGGSEVSPRRPPPAASAALITPGRWPRGRGAVSR